MARLWNHALYTQVSMSHRNRHQYVLYKTQIFWITTNHFLCPPPVFKLSSNSIAVIEWHLNEILLCWDLMLKYWNLHHWYELHSYEWNWKTAYMHGKNWNLLCSSPQLLHIHSCLLPFKVYLKKFSWFIHSERSDTMRNKCHYAVKTLERPVTIVHFSCMLPPLKDLDTLFRWFLDFSFKMGHITKDSFH